MTGVQTCALPISGYGNVMISRLLGLEQNGIYSIAVKFALVINLVAMCFNMAWQEVSFERGNEDRSSLSIFYSKAINLLISFLCIGMLCLIHFSYIIFPYMIDTQYAEAFSIIPLAILSAGIAVVSSFMGQIYAALKKNECDYVFNSDSSSCKYGMYAFVYFPLGGSRSDSVIDP